MSSINLQTPIVYPSVVFFSIRIVTIMVSLGLKLRGNPLPTKSMHIKSNRQMDGEMLPNLLSPYYVVDKYECIRNTCISAT